MSALIPLVKVKSAGICTDNPHWLLVQCENDHFVRRIRKYRRHWTGQVGGDLNVEDQPPKKIRCKECALAEQQRMAEKARELVGSKKKKDWKKELKKQAIGQSLHLALGMGTMTGVAFSSSPAGRWSAVSISAAWAISLVVHAVGRARKDKPVLQDTGDIGPLLLLWALSVSAPAFFGLDSWVLAMIAGGLLAIGREIMQQPTERIDDAVLDVVVTTGAAVGGFVMFAAIAKAVS